MVFCEELRRSVILPRGLIAMTGCGGMVFHARTRCGHGSSDFSMLSLHRGTKKGSVQADNPVTKLRATAQEEIIIFTSGSFSAPTVTPVTNVTPV
jgi:hypothetical protein